MTLEGAGLYVDPGSRCQRVEWLVNASRFSISAVGIPCILGAYWLHLVGGGLADMPPALLSVELFGRCAPSFPEG